jgi:hypothetical protein
LKQRSGRVYRSKVKRGCKSIFLLPERSEQSVVGQMSDSASTQLIPVQQVEGLIHLARGEKVLLDSDVAMLYGVETKALNRAVKRNRSRFPADFMFQLTAEEAANLKRQFGTSSSGHGGRRRSLPYAFTEQGVAMLSSVLRSDRAVQVNVAIMRAFVSLRRMLSANETLARKLAELERRLESHDEAIGSLFDAIRQLMAPPAKPHKQIGFQVREGCAPYGVKRKRP